MAATQDGRSQFYNSFVSDAGWAIVYTKELRGRGEFQKVEGNLYIYVYIKSIY